MPKLKVTLQPHKGKDLIAKSSAQLALQVISRLSPTPSKSPARRMEFQNVQYANMQSQFYEKSPTPRPLTTQPLVQDVYDKKCEFYSHFARSRSPSPFKNPKFQITKSNLFPDAAQYSTQQPIKNLEKRRQQQYQEIKKSMVAEFQKACRDKSA